MSYDLTIGILSTRRRDGTGGVEYRVGVAQEFEVGEPNYPATRPVLNREHILWVFKKSVVFSTYDEALCAARKEEREIKLSETFCYGIYDLKHSDLFFPATDRQLRRRGFFRRQQTQLSG